MRALQAAVDACTHVRVRAWCVFLPHESNSTAPDDANAAAAAADDDDDDADDDDDDDDDD